MTVYIKQALIFLFIIIFSYDLFPQNKLIGDVYYPKEHILESDTTFSISETNHNKTMDSDFEIIKSDFIVNTISGKSKANKTRPHVASDSSGNTLICWVDYRNGKKELYAQFYNADSNPIGNNILITDNQNEWNLMPSVAANKKGDFIITWAQTSSSIYAQKLFKDGSKVGNNFKVNSTSSWSLNYPSAAIDNNENVLFIWSVDNYNAQNQIYARLFNHSSLPLGTEFVLSELEFSNISSYGKVGQVAVDADGDFAAVWSAYHNGAPKIILQMINNSGVKSGNNVIISDLEPQYTSFFPSISAVNEGYFFIAWRTYYSGRNDKIAGRIFHKEQLLISDQLLFGEGAYNYSIASNWKDKFILCWSDNNKLNGQIIETNGYMANTASAIIFDTTYSRYVNDVQISNAVQNNFNLVFDDHENIYSQNFDTLFTPLTLSKIVNTDRFSSYQYDPQVCFNKNGGSIIIWNDRRSGSIDIYAQVYDSSFNRIGNEILINQNTLEGYFHTKNVKPTSDGNFIIAFSGYGYSNGRLYLQLINSSGVKVGNNILVSDYGANKIAMETNNDNELLLCWFGNYSSINQIQRFDGALKPLSAVKDLFDITTGLTKRNIDISINKNLDILASWIDYDYLNNSYAESYTSIILNKNGKMVAEVNDIPIELPSYVHLFNYLNDDGSIIFYWQNGYNLYINRVYKFGNGISLTNRFNYYSSSQIPKIFKMENQKAFFVLTVGGMVDAYFLNDYNYTQQKTNIHFFEGLSSLSGDIYNASDFDIRNNKMIFVYESNKNGGSGYDIWCNVQKVDSLNFDKEAKRLAIYEDTMFPIFPNPFNSSTIIAYELKQPTNVKISIYDILGREIDVLVNRFHEAGYNQINYNATGLASGMYFCVFEAKTTHVQKLLLVK